MGVPHLIATLEPYAEHEVLQDEDVVIDGPALAYHLLHICRANGIHQPSYHVLGLAVVKWLDELRNHRVKIQRIYFDGHLPSSKLSVRMQRMVKNNSRLNDFFSAHPKGPEDFSISQVTENIDFDVFQFAANHPRSKPLPDPSFLVPAAIDAIRKSSRYRTLLSIIPGEADAYCANLAVQRGGLVMTSDSDLLVHDLGQGKVVFLREIHRNATNGLSCLTFDPRNIYKKLGLPDSTEPCRFAYERRCSPHATTSRLVKACASPVADVVDYEEFRQQYLHYESAPLPLLKGDNTPLSLDQLDPRLSELLIQLGQLRCSPYDNESDAKIFLPTMMESPLEGTAWEPSTPMRQLAYTIASWALRCPVSVPTCIYEYRRVRQHHQKGRQVSLMSRDLMINSANRLHSLMSQVRKSLAGSTSSYYWIYLCLALNMMECDDQGKHSHVLKMLRKDHKASSYKSRGKLSWDLVHFVAHVQTGLYTMRMLAQVLSLMTDHCVETLAVNLSHIRHLLLSEFPSLLEFPDTSDILNFLEAARQNHVLESLERLTNVVITSGPETQKARDPRGQGQKGHQTPKVLPAVLGKHTQNNMFGLLDMDYDTR